MIMFLHGEDTYTSSLRLKKLKEGFKKKYDQQGASIKIFDEENFETDEFKKSITAQGLLTKKILVVVKNLISESSAKTQEDITLYLKESPPGSDVVVIFWEKEETAKKSKKGRAKTSNKPLLNLLLKEKHVEEFILPTGQRLNRWIQQEVTARQGKINPAAVNSLISLVGNNLWQLNNEIEKLIAYKKGGLINEEDVKLYVKAKFDENVFNFTDALGEKNKKISLKLLHDQIASGANELYLLTMILRQFRILLQVKGVLKEESNYYTVASRLKLHPFVAQKAVTQAQKYTIEELKEIYKKLLQMDLRIKTSPIDAKTLLDIFVVQTCN